MTGPGQDEPYGRLRLRRALAHFLTGRVLSSALGAVNLVALIRLLPAADFGLYAALLSVQVVFLALSSFGIETTMERYLPEVRLRSGRQAVLPFILRSLLLRLTALALAVSLLLLLLEPLLPWLGLGGHAAEVRLYVAVIVAVALMNSGGVALEALLHQRAAQSAAVLYAAVRSGLIFWAAQDGVLTVREVVLLDLAAAVAAFGLCLVALLPYGRDATARADASVRTDVWPRFRGFALRNYAGQTVMQTYGTHALRLAVTSLSGLVETARLGFAMSLAELLQRVLPATLLMRMIRPVFVSRYLERRDFAQLNAFANIVLKLNMLLLAPALAFALAAGAPLAAAVSADRYTDARWLLFGMLTLLASTSHQIVMTVLANTLEENDIQIKAALFALVGVPVALLAIPRLGALGALLAAWVSAVAYNGCAAWLLRRRGFAYHVDLPGLLRLLVAAAPAAAATWLVLRFGGSGVAALLGAALLCTTCFAGTAVLVRAFSQAERQIIHKLVPRRAFPF